MENNLETNNDIFLKRKGDYGEKIIKALFLSMAGVSVILVVFITGFMIYSGGPGILEVGIDKFFLGRVWDPVGDTPQYGIFTFIVSSIYGTIGAIIIGVPIGLLVSAAISKLAPRWLARIIKPAINLLAGIPSVIYGFVGLIVLVPFIGNLFNLALGTVMLTAIIVLAIMILPTIISVSENSISAVPETYMEASLALGVSKEYTVFNVIIPAARTGIMAGVLLGVGRAVGEAMAVLMVAGNSAIMPELLKPVKFLTTAIVSEMSYADGTHRSVLFSIGLVLFAFVMIINSIFRNLIKRAGKYNG